MQKQEGREKAMEMASKQNTHLLRLLEQQEAKGKVIVEENETLTMQLNVVREAHEKLTRGSAENEAKLKEQMKRVRKRAHETQREAELNQTKAMELQASLKEMERKAKVREGANET